MHFFTVILSLIAAAVVAPSALAPRAVVPRAVVPLAEICTDVNFKGSGITIVSPGPFDSAHPIGCGPMTAPFIKSIFSARGITDGYTFFLYPELNCGGTRLTDAIICRVNDDWEDYHAEWSVDTIFGLCKCITSDSFTAMTDAVVDGDLGELSEAQSDHHLDHTSCD
ncbi:hypothetical protein FB451DRAFT_1556536 [Mycena latifolia]|nr:hypothetical protein FB451DRAFT_1556536 [Mycena latifolia]